jgi:hypothetical protein
LATMKNIAIEIEVNWDHDVQCTYYYSCYWFTSVIWINYHNKSLLCIVSLWVYLWTKDCQKIWDQLHFNSLGWTSTHTGTMAKTRSGSSLVLINFEPEPMVLMTKLGNHLTTVENPKIHLNCF